LEGTTEFDDYPFWIRSTAARPEKRYENRPWEFWQFTTTGRVPGISGDVDRNAFYGNDKQFTDWLAGRYDIGARRPMNASSRIAQPRPVDVVPRPESRTTQRATPPMDLRPPRTPGVTGSIGTRD
ncbi:MAG: GH25 family lysozyme, partial [Bosea sp. (in: a-proteobacteria)]